MLLFVFVVLYISKSNVTVTMQVRVQTIQGVAEKKYPHKIFWQHFPNDWKFFTTVLHTFLLVHIYAKLQNFIQLSLTLTKLCHIKRDHLVNFYISLEKREKLRCLCNSMI